MPSSGRKVVAVLSSQTLSEALLEVARPAPRSCGDQALDGRARRLLGEYINAALRTSPGSLSSRPNRQKAVAREGSVLAL